MHQQLPNVHWFQIPDNPLIIRLQLLMLVVVQRATVTIVSMHLPSVSVSGGNLIWKHFCSLLVMDKFLFLNPGGSTSNPGHCIPYCNFYLHCYRFAGKITVSNAVTQTVCSWCGCFQWSVTSSPDLFVRVLQLH